MAAANILGPLLQNGVPRFADLKKVQARREWPARLIQGMQVMAQNNVLSPVLKENRAPKVPRIVKLLNAWPWARQFPARFIGLGPRPEHVTLRARKVTSA